MAPATGQIFIAPLEGIRIKPAEKRWLEKIDVGGVILYRRNIKSPGQVLNLCRAIHRLHLSSPPFICIDHEGGTVHRLPAGYIHLPAAHQQGKLWRTKTGANALLAWQEHSTRQVLASGFNLNFNPVVNAPKRLVGNYMGNRSYATDPRTVGEIVGELITCYNQLGLISCAKHFPGHGGTLIDTHRGLPTIRRGLKQLERRELIPYKKAITAGVPLIMTAHIIYKTLDPNLPATLSSKILHEILRKRLKFRGLIVADDMQMKGVSLLAPYSELSAQTLLAGCELQIFGLDLASVIAGWRGVKGECAKNRALSRRLESALAKIKALKGKFMLSRFRGNGQKLKDLLD